MGITLIYQLVIIFGDTERETCLPYFPFTRPRCYGAASSAVQIYNYIDTISNYFIRNVTF